MTNELYITRQGNNHEMLDTLLTGWTQAKGQPSNIKRGSAFGVTYAISDLLTGATRLYFQNTKKLAAAREWCLRFASERGIAHVNII